jgi:hypothetical protein
MRSNTYCTIRIYELNQKRYIDFIGIDFGSNVRTEILEETENYYLTKRNGGTAYLQRGQYTYAKPSYNILEKVKPQKGDTGALKDWIGIEIEYDRKTKKDAFDKILAVWGAIRKIKIINEEGEKIWKKII